MRLFIAAELPDEILDALAETSALLRGRVKGRFVSPHSFHVTLAFLGDVEGYRVDNLCAVFERSCAGFEPSFAQLGELGCFGKRSKATLWQGFREQGMLSRLAQSIRSELQSEEFSFDEKKFLPHITLGRAVDLTAGELPSPVLAEGTVSSITLFHSDLSGARPAYEPVHEIELLPCAQ